ncbi:MAG: ATP-binding protein [Gracilibacteraceae bacterium]|nr:ATP-binding protein [Gracilibacteraceae bacterium]
MTKTNRFEYKQELNDRLERAVVSFLNYSGGGEVIIGVDSNGVACGVDDPDGTQLKIVDRIRNNIRPHI